MRWPKRLRCDANESDSVRLRGMFAEGIIGNEVEEVASRRNHDIAFEWQLLGKSSTQDGDGWGLANDKRSNGANVNDVKFRKLLGNCSGSASVGGPDVYGAKEDDR